MGGGVRLRASHAHRTALLLVAAWLPGYRIAMLPQCELMVVSRRFNLSGFNTFYKSLGY